MRIDKFLKNSRIIKRRTVAKTACESKRVKINDKIAKPGDNVKVGDIIEISFAQSVLKAKVTELIDNPKKDDADKMFETLGD